MSSDVVLKTLAHRLGVRELEDDLRKQLTVDFNSESLSVLTQSKDWQIRAAALCVAFQRFEELDCDIVVQSVLANIDHENNRTRLETLPLIRQLAQTSPQLAWDKLAVPLLNIAKSTIQLDEDTRGIEAERQGMKETKQPELDDFEFCEVYKDMALEIDIYRTKLFSTLALEDPNSAINNNNNNNEQQSVRSSRLSSSGWSARRRLDSGQVVLMVHETVGWKSLETSLRGLNALLPANNNTDFAFAITKQALEHTNRFVRVVAYELAETLANNTLGFPQIAAWIKRGMCDHVNEVRLRACLACKAVVQTKTITEADLLTLAPVLCLNRHYPQVGIRDPSVEAWRLGGGFTRDLVTANVLVFCRFFIQQSSSSRDEFAREASCCAMGEMANRILDADDSRGVLQEITNALLARLTDSSWSVQAAACQAIGEAVCKQPALVSTQLVEALVECASDLIWSVRDEAAITLAKLCNAAASEEHVVALVRAKCREMMLRAPTVHHHHHHPPTENQVMFACCSSEINDKTKLRKQDFQYVDGGLRLFREVMVQSKLAEKDVVVDEDPLVEDFLNFVQRDGNRHDVVEETVWQLVVPLAQKIGKKQFKRKALDAILPSLVRALEHPCFSAAYKASLACQFFKEWVGENILRARVEAISPALWGIVERNPPQVFDSPAISFRV